jgi:hypothetical protein
VVVNRKPGDRGGVECGMDERGVVP